MFSQRFKSKYTIGAFLLLFACSPICFGESGEDGNKDNKVNILFSYGPGGPLKPNNEFFAGDGIYFYVEADANLAKDTKFDLMTIPKLLNENADIVSLSEPQNHTNGFFFNGQSTFHITAYGGLLPDNLKKGNYFLHVSIRDMLNHSEHLRQIPITVKEKQEFGLRRIGFCHGMTGSWVVGSNVFNAGEIAVLTCVLGGVEKNHDNVLDTANLNSELSILNLKREVINCHPWQSSPLIFNGLVDGSFTLPLPQPGEFIVKLRVEDMISGKADTCELPLIVLPVPSPVSAGGRGLGN